jgi:hypothetical protein
VLITWFECRNRVSNKLCLDAKNTVLGPTCLFGRLATNVALKQRSLLEQPKLIIE